MEYSIIFIGNFDKNLLVLEEEVLNIDNNSDTPTKLIEKYDGSFDINSINPTIDKHYIDKYKCKLWVIIGNVRPNIALKTLISKTNIVILVFNLNEPNTLTILNEGWLPIFEQINAAQKNQKRLLVGTRNETKNYESNNKMIQTTMQNFKCTEYLEIEINDNTIDISNKLNQCLQKQLKSITSMNNTLLIENSIIFIGMFDKNFLQLEEEVLNIANFPETPKKLIKRSNDNFDIDSIIPTVDKHLIEEYKCDIFVTLGNVRPNIALNKLISKTKIVIVVFNLEEPDTLTFLNKEWFPIFEQIKTKHKDQEVLLVGTGNESTKNEIFINEIKKTIQNFNCTEYFECEKTSKNKYETKDVTINISKNLIDHIKNKLKPIKIDKRENDNENYIEEEAKEFYEDEEFYEEEEEEEYKENTGESKREKEIKNNDDDKPLKEKSIENKEESTIFKSNNNVSYRLNKTSFTAEIIESPEVEGDVSIPTFIEFESNQYTIIRVCDFSFANSKIKSLSFSKESKVEQFGASIFKESTIEKLYIPQSLNEINENWIDCAYTLEKIDVDKNNQYIENDANKILKILFSPHNFKGKYWVPGETTCIGRSAFIKRQGIKSFKSYKSLLRKIESFAFSQCKSLESFTFISNLELTLGAFCFSQSSILSTIEITCKSIKIGKECFSDCSSLSAFILKVSKDVTLNSGLFKNCYKLENIAITHAKTIKIDDECFSDVSLLKSAAFTANSIILGNNIFVNCKLLSYVVIQSQQDINISADTFKDSNLKNINIKTSAKLKLEEKCFEQSVNLDTIEFKFNSIDITNECFSKCSQLKFISIQSESDISINDIIFSNCKSLQKLVLSSKSSIILCDNCMNESSQLESIEIIGRDIIIGNGCFNNCPFLSNFSIKKSGKIEFHANEFINCDKLESIYLESTIEKEQGEGYQIIFYPKCFNQLKALKNILIAGGEIKINESSFINCASLHYISITQASNVYIEQNLFLNNESLKIILIESNSSIFLKPNCFNGCINLETINISGKAIFIGDNCFTKCTNIKEIQILNVEELSIGEKAFLNCSNLQKVYFEAKSKITIKNNCFVDTKVETATFQGNTICICSKCFEVSSIFKSPKINTVDITCEQLIIKDECFKNCSSLATFSVKNAKEIELGNNAFESCKSIENISLNAESSLLINDNCFLKAINLKTLEFESKEVLIGTLSFNDCNSLISIKSQKSDKVILGKKSFSYCSSLKEIDITANLEFQVGDFCFRSLRNLQTVKVNSKKINIGDFSFYNCTSIKNVSFPTAIDYSFYDSSFYPIFDKINFHINPNAIKRRIESEKLVDHIYNEENVLYK